MQSKTLTLLTKRSDIAFSLAGVGIIAVLIVPLPSVLMDILLSFNLAVTFMVFLLTVYVKRPLDFSVFPSLLLLVTLFRLSLNVASTRLILLHAYAGRVIQAFGYFVVGGNYVVGIIVFVILVVINFIVITRGATRISEVAARFTLDSMPGKQMSVDADLNAGLITEEEARKRRFDIERQADFYGAMDGASKFVRGDAIAAIIILMVNIIGGLAIGILQHKMPPDKALHTYTLLTVGDGMVSQIPALLISTAAGIIITRSSSESHLALDFVSQILSQPKAIAIVAFLLFLFALLPGLPKIPLFLLAFLVAGVYYIIRKSEVKEPHEEEIKKREEEKKESIEELLRIDPLEIEIGYGLIPLVDTSQGGDVLERITLTRRQLALELGIVVPPIRVRDNIQLEPNNYRIKIRGMEVAKGELMLKQYLAMDTGMVEKPLKGIKTKDPAFGLPAIWIKEEEREEAEKAGYVVVNASSVFITHLTEVIRSHAYELLGRQEVKNLLDNIQQDYPAVVEELIPNLLSLGEVQKVLQNLLKERVSIRDLLTILETLADWASQTKNIDILTEYVRQSLARTISKQYQNEQGEMWVITLDPHLEQELSQAIEHKEKSSYIRLDPSIIQKIIDRLSPLVKKAISFQREPIVLCSSGVRVFFKRVVEKFIPSLVVLSYNEIVSEVKVKTVGVLQI
ncbi:flagellar biosynthesis protein FlhA [Candidatus Aerophobetes bacterium]|nr:flagellar biosynthesis protein FlhA [Candidatus Aerophobetes bacterium]